MGGSSRGGVGWGHAEVGCIIVGWGVSCRGGVCCRGVGWGVS